MPRDPPDGRDGVPRSKTTRRSAGPRTQCVSRSRRPRSRSPTFSSRMTPIACPATSRASSSVGIRCQFPASSRYLLERHFGECPRFVGGAIDGVIVQQHEMTVAGFAQINLDKIDME